MLMDLGDLKTWDFGDLASRFGVGEHGGRGSIIPANKLAHLQMDIHSGWRSRRASGAAGCNRRF
jgi:hypothetical protein